MMEMVLHCSELLPNRSLCFSSKIFNRKPLSFILAHGYIFKIVFHVLSLMERRCSVGREVTEPFLFSSLCFHAVVTQDASELMCMQELPCMSFNVCKLCVSSLLISVHKVQIVIV